MRDLAPRLSTQSGQPKTDGCDECDSGEEVSGEPVVARGDTPPVLHPAEHTLDDVAPAIRDPV